MLQFAIKNGLFLLQGQFLPDILLHLAEFFVDVVFKSEFNHHVPRLLNLAIEAHDLFLVRQVHASVLKLDEFRHQDILLESLLNHVQVFFHCRMRRSHLDNLNVVSQRSQVAQGFIDSLHELRRKARLHVLKLTL